MIKLIQDLHANIYSIEMRIVELDKIINADNLRFDLKGIARVEKENLIKKLEEADHSLRQHLM